MAAKTSSVANCVNAQHLIQLHPGLARATAFTTRFRKPLMMDQIEAAAVFASHHQVALYSADKRPSFFGNILRNIKEEYSKSSEMQESLKKFREDAKKLEESDALKEARRKFKNIEGEAEKGSSVFREHMSGIADKVRVLIELK